MNDLQAVDWIIKALLGVVLAVLLWRYKTAEAKNSRAVSEEEVRNLIRDLSAPEKVRLHEIQRTVEQINLNLRDVEFVIRTHMRPIDTQLYRRHATKEGEVEGV